MSSQSILADDDIVTDTFFDDEPIPNFLCDDDVSITNATHDVDDQVERARYFEDCFEKGDTTKWLYDKTLCSRVERNGASTRNLKTLKASINPILEKCSRIVGKEINDFEAMDFMHIGLNRNFYLMFQDYINARIFNLNTRATLLECKEMVRVWLLQCIYKTPSKNILEDEGDWYSKS